MIKKQFKKYKFVVWLANLIILLSLITLLIAGLYFDSLHYIFLSEEFPKEHLGFLNKFAFGIFSIDGPLILPIISIAFLIILANLKVFYRDRYKHEKETGTYKNNEAKRNLFEKNIFRYFIYITLLNILIEAYLIYNTIFKDLNSVLLENLMIIGFVFLGINIAITVGLGFSRK